MKASSFNPFERIKENIYLESNSSNFFIKNLHSNRLFKIDELVYTILDLIQKNDYKNYRVLLKDLRKEKSGKDLKVKDIEFLLENKLQKIGVFDTEKNILKGGGAKYLVLNKVLFNGNQIRKITKYFEFLFQPFFVFLSLIFILSGSIFFATRLLNNFENFSLNILFQNFNLVGLGFIVFLFFFVITAFFHELGHATASEFFGKKQEGVGIGFYLFMPVFFTDLTNTWKLDKKKRVVVDLAGLYFQSIITILFCLIFYFIGLEWFSGLLFISLVLGFVINLNPFTRADGYWILSDLSGSLNLRHDSYNTFQEFLKTKKIENWVLFLYFILTVFYFSTIILAGIIFLEDLINLPFSVFNLLMEIIERKDFSRFLTFGFLREIFIPLVFVIFTANFIKKFVEYKKSDSKNKLNILDFI
jgi:putative peptide zinc metalloprotease protein